MNKFQEFQNEVAEYACKELAGEYEDIAKVSGFTLCADQDLEWCITSWMEDGETLICDMYPQPDGHWQVLIQGHDLFDVDHAEQTINQLPEVVRIYSAIRKAAPLLKVEFYPDFDRERVAIRISDKATITPLNADAYAVEIGEFTALLDLPGLLGIVSGHAVLNEPVAA